MQFSGSSIGLVWGFILDLKDIQLALSSEFQGWCGGIIYVYFPKENSLKNLPCGSHCYEDCDFRVKIQSLWEVNFGHFQGQKHPFQTFFKHVWKLFGNCLGIRFSFICLLLSVFPLLYSNNGSDIVTFVSKYDNLGRSILAIFRVKNTLFWHFSNMFGCCLGIVYSLVLFLKGQLLGICSPNLSLLWGSAVALHNRTRSVWSKTSEK